MKKTKQTKQAAIKPLNTTYRSEGGESYVGIEENATNEIINFLDCSKGFTYSTEGSLLTITQEEDRKEMICDLTKVEKVLVRQDFDGTHFLQVNYIFGAKILITKNLIGFKPVEYPGFDPNKIPKVVTTVDLKSVKRAIEDTYEEDSLESEVELEVLKKVYQSILSGAESVGFKMADEKQWFLRNLHSNIAASA